MTGRVKRLIGLLVVGMVVVHASANAAADPEHVKKLRVTKVCVQCDLQDADLRGMDLRNGNVTKSDFRGADLYTASFRGADLTDAVFAGANLDGADLRDTKGASLAGANTSERTVCPNGAPGPCSQ